MSTNKPRCHGKIIAISTETDEVREFQSMREVEKAFKSSHNTIRARIRNGSEFTPLEVSNGP